MTKSDIDFRKIKFRELICDRRGNLSNPDLARELSESGTDYSPQVISKWTHENLDEVPDPKRFSIERAEQLAIALGLDPDQFIHEIRTMKPETIAEDSTEKKIVALMAELERLSYRQAQTYKQLKQLQELSMSQMPSLAVQRISGFLQGLMAKQRLNWRNARDLRQFALKPSEYKESQWQDEDVTPPNGRVWRIFNGESVELNESDYARLAVCCQYLSQLEYTIFDLAAIAEGLNPDELSPDPFNCDDHRFSKR